MKTLNNAGIKNVKTYLGAMIKDCKNADIKDAAQGTLNLILSELENNTNPTQVSKAIEILELSYYLGMLIERDCNNRQNK